MLRILFVFLFLLEIQCGFSQAPALGAIRWDAWTGASNGIGVQVEEALSPSKFHYRVPFFGTEVDSITVKIDGTSQLIMDQEIEFAKYAGLSYWAFVWYASASGLDEARKLYYSSSKKNLIDYCLIVEQSRFNTENPLGSMVQEFKDPSYFRVMNGRPLLYLLGYAGIRVTSIDSLRTMCIDAGLANPYIVELRVDGNMNVLDNLHLDAFGMYATTWVTNGVPYKNLANTDIDQWNWTGKTMGKKIVPHVTTGWDTRPIHDHPLSWYVVANPNDYVVQASPEEISDHIQEAISWINTNPAIAEANTILIYAWNEHAEGGWICPTLSNYGYTDRIDTMHARFYKQDPTSLESHGTQSSSIYPNPTSSHLTLDIENSGSWSVSNLSGIELLKGNGAECNLSSLSSGLYIIRVNHTNFRIIKI